MADPRTLPLLGVNCLKPVGTFTMPGMYNGQYVTYAGTALAVSPDGTELYMAGYASQIFRMTIPAVGGQAQITANAVIDIRSVSTGADTSGLNVGGLLIHNNRLIASGYTFYDNVGAHIATHLAGTAGNMGTAVRVNPNVGPGLVAGYMCHIPPDWQGVLGGTALTGQGCISIIRRSSFGPALHVFDPAQIGSGGGSVPGTMVLGFPDSAPRNFGDYSVKGPNYQGTEWIGGVAFPRGTRTVMVIWRKGSTYCYDTGQVCGDPTSDDKGPHGYPYKIEALMYDALEFERVKNGQKQPWDVMPYARFDLQGVAGLPGHASLGSVAFDPVKNRLYLKRSPHGIGAGEDPPVIQMWDLVGGVTPPTGPSSSPSASPSKSPSPSPSSSPSPSAGPPPPTGKLSVVIQVVSSTGSSPGVSIPVGTKFTLTVL